MNVYELIVNILKTLICYYLLGIGENEFKVIRSIGIKIGFI